MSKQILIIVAAFVVFAANISAQTSGEKPPLPNSIDYIQNRTDTQPFANFNISGEGRAEVLSANTQFNLGNNRVFHLTGVDNAFVGLQSGNAIAGGSFNAFFGSYSGRDTTSGINNSFFGSYAGRGNIEGGNNAFFGANAGLSSNGSSNAFFGSAAGLNNFSGYDNTFVGTNSGQENTTGYHNVAVGKDAGKNNTTGANNTYVGAFSGSNNASITGTSNTIVGYNASVAPNVSFATAIGESAYANQNNQVAIGTAASTVKISGQLEVSGLVKVADLAGNGTTPLCRGAGNFISTCAAGRPAEDDLAALREQLRQQQAQIDALKTIICSADPRAAVCVQVKK